MRDKISNSEKKQCFCGRDVFDKERCVFHSDDLAAKKTVFNESFWKEFDRQKKEEEIFDFSGFIFPDSIYFHRIKFDRIANFNSAEFFGEKTFFVNSRFLGEKTLFCGAIFHGKITDFSKSCFSGKMTYFSNARFLGENTYFKHARFSGEYIDFSNAEFTGENTYFHFARFSGDKISFNQTVFSNKNMFSEVYL